VVTVWTLGRHTDCGVETREKPILIGVRVIMDVLRNMRKVQIYAIKKRYRQYYALICIMWT
jgi:hypothetical protein